MNWSKAKTILIIVFLIADIFLFYVTYTGDISNNGIIGKNSMAQIIEHLENQGILVKSFIPSKGNPSPLLYVKYKLLNKEEAKEIFFDLDDNIIVKENEQKISMESSKILLEMLSNGDIFYLNKSLNNKDDGNIDEAQAQKNIDEFLKLLDIDQNDAIVVNKVIEDNSIIIRYNQSYKNQFIDNTYLEIKTTNKGVAYVKMLWFESVKNGKTKNEVISPIKALMKLSELYRQVERTVTVEDISQGYYFSFNIEQAFDVKSVEEGTAIPVWRIKTDLGNIYINAYNGTVEEN